MKKLLIYSFIFFICQSVSGQIDSNSLKSYIIKVKYPFFQYCKNCNSPKNLHMLCGHSYNNFFLGYSYDLTHRAEIGYSKDIASCYPDKGGQLFSVAITTDFNKKLINGLKISYLRDNLLGLQFYYLKFGLNTEIISNYEKVEYLLRPEIRLIDNMDFNQFFYRINISYAYNIDFGKNLIYNRGKHQITLTWNFSRHGWIS